MSSVEIAPIASLTAASKASRLAVLQRRTKSLSLAQSRSIGLNSGEYLRFPPEGFSLRWVQDFLTSPTFLPAYLYSLRLAFAAMVIATVLGTMAAIFLTRANFPGRGAVRAFFLAPLLLPGLVIGLALYVYYLNFPLLKLNGTFWGMLLGNFQFQCLLGLPTPDYLHLPLVLDAEGRKLSKSAASLPVDAGDPLPALRSALAWLGVDIRSAATRPERILRDALDGFSPASLRRSSLTPAPTL